MHKEEVATNPTPTQLQGETLHEPPLTIDKLFCPKCGQTDGPRSLKTRHYSRGSLCDGTPITITYTSRAAVAGPRTDIAVDRAYIAGAQFGWNCGVEGAHEMFELAIRGRQAEVTAATSSPTPAERNREIFDAGFSAERTEVEGEQEKQ